MGVGVCSVTDIERPVCSECGTHTSAYRFNAGIGPIEYWGAKSVHNDWRIGSTCCHAPLIDPETGNDCTPDSIDPPEPEYDPWEER